MVIDFVFEIAPRIFDRLVVFVFSVVLLIVGFRVVLLVTVLLVVLLDSIFFNTKVGFFITIGRFGNCNLFVVLFSIDATVPLIDDLSVVLLAAGFSVRLLIIGPLVVLFPIDFSVVLLITLINNDGLSVVLFVARLSVVIINACGSSIQLLFVMTFNLEVSTVFATDLGVIKAIGSILATGCVCFSKILIVPSG